jgi:hypothetical protein
VEPEKYVCGSWWVSAGHAEATLEGALHVLFANLVRTPRLWKDYSEHQRRTHLTTIISLQRSINSSLRFPLQCYGSLLQLHCIYKKTHQGVHRLLTLPNYHNFGTSRCMFAPPLYHSHKLRDNHFSTNSSPEAFLLKFTTLVQESYAQNTDFEYVLISHLTFGFSRDFGRNDFVSEAAV